MKIKYHSLLCILATIALSSPLSALSVNAQKAVSKTWNPNLKNGMYRNPVIDADYSDPDVCRVGNDYYMTSSSFQCFPGLQILHSTDLVNWEIIGAALLADCMRNMKSHSPGNAPTRSSWRSLSNIPSLMIWTTHLWRWRRM